MIRRVGVAPHRSHRVLVAAGCPTEAEVDPARIQKRLDTGYCDIMETDLDKALADLNASDIAVIVGGVIAYRQDQKRRRLLYHWARSRGLRRHSGDPVRAGVLRASQGRLQRCRA